MTNGKIIQREARAGSWAVWRLLVACRICRSVEGARRMVTSGLVGMPPTFAGDLPWRIDSLLDTVPLGQGQSLSLVVNGLTFTIYGINPDDPRPDEVFPDVNTSGMNEPPIAGARLIASGAKIAKPKKGAIVSPSSLSAPPPPTSARASLDEHPF